MASQEVLQAFVQAATQGSFSAAARKLGRSQSTVSAAVASLEIDLDLILFGSEVRQSPELALPHPRAPRVRRAIGSWMISTTRWCRGSVAMWAYSRATTASGPSST